MAGDRTDVFEIRPQGLVMRSTPNEIHMISTPRSSFRNEPYRDFHAWKTSCE